MKKNHWNNWNEQGIYIAGIFKDCYEFRTIVPSEKRKPLCSRKQADDGLQSRANLHSFWLQCFHVANELSIFCGSKLFLDLKKNMYRLLHSKQKQVRYPLTIKLKTISSHNENRYLHTQNKYSQNSYQKGLWVVTSSSICSEDLLCA